MRNQKGLTLIEVLVSLVVLSTVVGSILVLMSQQTRQAARLEERMLARIAAENALTAFVIAKKEQNAPDVQGDIAVGDLGFRFEIDREAAPLQGYELVRADVRKARDGQVLASLTTLQKSQVAPTDE
ncbi:type II secretion system minor pseudopilin GspI [Parvularcula sp. ZS-1/3]|uniref:Type II secretion system protein I n=1 Tax=Parvularcula mediterranea TaxID=2732508 RepID=A0A7Y3W631_9PROT|nr:type II secretion system minor pseudopilin GspI [Parvularcula mediterranea]NNU17108.1 type II secretion system minor pseudopilin GspI [Parvularcula mediterranea]